MKILSAFLSVLILFSGCTSTASMSGKPQINDEGQYKIKIDKTYYQQQIKYIINEFVKSIGYDSYDMEIVGLSDDDFNNYSYYTYVITVPGSIPVEKMKKEKYKDEEKTNMLVSIIFFVITAPLIGYVVDNYANK